MKTERTSKSRGAGLLPILAVWAWTGAAQAQSLDEIIDAAVAAVGGREAIARIESVSRVGTFSMATDFGDLGGETEVVVIPNQKLPGAFEIDTTYEETVINGPVDEAIFEKP